MNSIGIVYDGSDHFPRLHRALPLCELGVEAVCDLATSNYQQENVDRLVHTMGVTDRYNDLPSMLQRMNSSHLLVDISSQSKLKLYDVIKEALLTREGIKIAIPQPSSAFSGLPTHQVVKLFAMARKNNGKILATSRLLFSKSFSELVRLVNTQPHFGEVADLRCLYRCGVVPGANARAFMIGRSAAPAFHVIFALMKIAPELIVVVEKNNENYPPVYSVTLQFPRTIANCMLTASRNWGDRYNQIDVGGTSGASFESDFLTWSTISKEQPSMHVPIINDDDETGTIAGAAGKINALFLPVSDENWNAQDTIVLRTFALRDAIYELLEKNDSSTTPSTTVTLKQIQRVQRKILNTKSSSIDQRIAAKMRMDDFSGAIQEALEAL